MPAVVDSRIAKPMSRAQRIVLRELDTPMGFTGYCELQMETGLSSYKAVDWVLDALERRGYITPNGHGDGYDITEAGKAALAALVAQ